MAQRKKVKRQPKAAQAKRRRRQGTVALGQRNVLLLVAGIVVILIGYFLLGRGSITAAPLLLVIGYCVMVPLSLVLWMKKPQTKEESTMGE
jgi:hypothetical protein